ncbi:hypothetical protein Poli38472_002838 [Pythium oligandrum]|uniref:Uncharacterized protein n=1 Tax=Pythium oligandrum TaxID=41045 RepID=A0A8K1C5Q7_PYTOL|nr:hypothetical protein Poli38472_002838 [Pythium oligandrum]|eukprot:TMW56913.1 hypothetical protein Poli38472_002838 [Pythium oligandrum]
MFFELRYDLELTEWNAGCHWVGGNQVRFQSIERAFSSEDGMSIEAVILNVAHDAKYLFLPKKIGCDVRLILPCRFHFAVEVSNPGLDHRRHLVRMLL